MTEEEVARLSPREFIQEFKCSVLEARGEKAIGPLGAYPLAIMERVLEDKLTELEELREGLAKQEVSF